MYRILGVILLIIGVGTAIYLYLTWPKDQEPARFLDRLPEADIIGKANVLDFATEIMPTLYYYQIPIREFVSPDFILGQGKAYGLDFQKPIYFFGSVQNDRLKEWGLLISVDDSSKVLEGIRNMANIGDIHDTTVLNMHAFTSPDLNLVMSYSKDWMLIASTNKFPAYLNHVVNAKHNGLSSRWKEFLADKTFENKSFVFRAISPRLKRHKIESILCATSSDSTSITFHTRVDQYDSVSFTLKPYGQGFPQEEFTKSAINAHFDVEKFRGNQEDPIYKLLKKAGSPVSFPLNSFLDAWDGDVAFRQGGIQLISEKYIESELDENFMVTEVTKYKQSKISGFSLYLSMNKNKSQLLTDVFDKGILTKDGNKVRLLYSPPMNMRASDTSLMFYTSRYAPLTITDSTHHALWTIDYTPVSFTLDSVKAKSAFGKITVPLNKLIRDYLPIK